MTESERQHLDAIAGVQIAMIAALSALLKQHKGNQTVLDELQTRLTLAQNDLIYSSASDYKSSMFEQTGAALLELLS